MHLQWFVVVIILVFVFLHLQFSLIDLFIGRWDYVEIAETKTGRSSRYCGWNPLTYIAESNDVTVRFVSDDSYEDRGFKFTISAIPGKLSNDHKLVMVLWV